MAVLDETRRPSAAAPAAAHVSLCVLEDIVCGVDGTRTSYEAVRQAAFLAAGQGRLTLLTVAGEAGSGAYRGAVIDPTRARDVLEHARRIARKAGVEAAVQLDNRAPVPETVLQHAPSNGLLVLGTPSMSLFGQLFFGGVTSLAAHQLPSSLLVTRRPPREPGFPRRVIVASDGLDGSDELVRFAIRFADRYEATLQLLHAVGVESRSDWTRLARQGEAVCEGPRGVGRLCVASGGAGHVTSETASRERASLLILLSHRAGGLRALGSVSERVVHDAPCSVLLMRSEDLGERL